jgi:hypothetical protein
MVDLTQEMGSLWAALGPAPPNAGRVIQFVSATTGEGVSTVARAFARLAAGHAKKPVWLIDADLDAQTQMAAIAAAPDLFGPLGRVAGASPDGSCFFTVQPPSRDAAGQPTPDAHRLIARPVLDSRLWVTRLRSDTIHPEQRVRLMPTAAYWTALRRHAGYIIIDSPALDRSDAALTLAPFVDATVIVLAAEETEARAAGALRDALEQAGGQVAGLVVNRVKAGAAKPSRRRAS